jgi:TonB family protein
VIDESAPASYGIEIDPVIEEHAPAILSGAAGRAAPGAGEWYPDAVVLPGVPVRHRAPHRLLLRASRWAEDAAGLVGLLVLLTILTWGPLSRAVTALARGSGPATVTLEGKEPAGIVAQRAVPAPQSASAARGGASDVDGSKDASQDDRSPAPEPEPPVNPGNSRPIESAALRPTAEMRVLVTSEGWVQEVQVLRSSGDRELDQRAMARIHQLTYVPARRNGAPAAVWIRQPVVFNVR